MIVSLLVLAASALALSSLAALDRITIWRVIVIAMVTGTATAALHARHALVVPSLVEEGDLLDAITLNSVQFNLARAVGPALAGLLYGADRPRRLLRGERLGIPRARRRDLPAASPAAARPSRIRR